MRNLILGFSGVTQDTLEQIVRNYGIILLVVFGVALVATWACRKLALKLGIVDYPDGQVKTHAQPTAYLGGVGMWVGIMVGLILGYFIMRQHSEESSADNFSCRLMLIGIGLGATIACLVGLLDDMFDIKPWQKFLGQALAGGVIIWVGIYPNLQGIFTELNLELPVVWFTVIGIPLALLIILGTTNSLNLLDGLDGLCAGVTAIISIAFLILTVSTTSGRDPTVASVSLILCLTLVGVTLGFLPLNRHPAKIFMGDAGSMLLGFISGTLIILFFVNIGRWSTAVIIIFGLPILDTAVAVVRRWINKKPLFVSDRSHIYDQLMDRGLTLSKTVKICYVLAIFFAVVGLFSMLLRFRYTVLIFLVLVVLSSILIRRGNFLSMPDKDE